MMKTCSRPVSNAADQGREGCGREWVFVTVCLDSTNCSPINRESEGHLLPVFFFKCTVKIAGHLDKVKYSQTNRKLEKSKIQC